MHKLSSNILAYYLSRFDELGISKQAHFAANLHLWCQEPQVAEHVRALRPQLTAQEHPKIVLERLAKEARTSVSHGSKNVRELRRPYFKQYPMLRAYTVVLLQLNFLQTVYGIDCRKLFYRLFSKSEVLRLKNDLLQDVQALSILSTQAINFLYMLERSVHENDDSLPLEHLLEIGKNAHNRSDKLHLQLLIYFYTHCIIGDTRFYYRPLPVVNLPVYIKMLTELDALLQERFTEINLDNKFEFLVCCKIAGFASSCEQRIFDEANRSVSPEGTFLIDTHNTNPQSGNVSLDRSEHRNVLFIMANRDFRPLG